jgi:hypothetical protein
VNFSLFSQNQNSARTKEQNQESDKNKTKTMKFSSIAILLINAYGATAFSPTINNARGIRYTKSTTGTKLLYLKDETAVPAVALINNIIPTSVA